MDKKALDEVLLTLVGKKIELSKLDYNQEEYDEVEEELHDLEDDFMDDYGKDLEKVLKSIHDEYCPDTDVLMPIAYLANEYKPVEVDGEITFTTTKAEGVIVDVDEGDFAPSARLVLLPKPARFILHNASGSREVWNIRND